MNKYELINETIGLIDFDLIEAAGVQPEKSKIKPLKPWVKWIAVAAIAVIAVVTPVAVYTMSAFKNDNYASPNNNGAGNENSAILSPVDSSELKKDSISASKVESDSNDCGNPTHNGSSEHGSSENNSVPGTNKPGISGGSSTKTPEDPGLDSSVNNSSGTSDIGGSGNPLSFDGKTTTRMIVKDNIPAVTYRINGKDKTFSYSDSTLYIVSAEMNFDGEQIEFTVDHYYIKKDGSVARSFGGTGELMEYYASDSAAGSGEPISEDEAAEIAKAVLLNTDLPFSTLENVTVMNLVSTKRTYEISFSFAGGSADIVLKKAGGGLKSIILYKDYSAALSQERKAAARERLDKKIEEYKNSNPGVRVVVNSTRYDELGNKIYAIFDLEYFPNPNSEAYERYEFYCAV